MLVILEFIIVFVLKTPLASRDFSISFSFYSFFFPTTSFVYGPKPIFVLEESETFALFFA